MTPFHFSDEDHALVNSIAPDVQKQMLEGLPGGAWASPGAPQTPKKRKNGFMHVEILSKNSEKRQREAGYGGLAQRTQYYYAYYAAPFF